MTMHMEPNSERSPCTQKKSTASSLSHSKRPRLSFPQENLGQLKKRKLKIMKENTLPPLDRPDLCASLFHREFLRQDRNGAQTFIATKRLPSGCLATFLIASAHRRRLK